MKKLIFLASCILLLGTARAQYNSNGIVTGTNFYNNTQDGAGGFSANGYVLNYYYPANLSANSTVIAPGTYQFKKVEQTATKSTPGTVTDTLYTDAHVTRVDSIDGIQTVTFYANQYVTAGAKVTLRAGPLAGDTAHTLYVKFGSASVDTLTPSTTVYRTYFFDGTTLVPWYK